MKWLPVEPNSGCKTGYPGANDHHILDGIHFCRVIVTVFCACDQWAGELVQATAMGSDKRDTYRQKHTADCGMSGWMMSLMTIETKDCLCCEMTQAVAYSLIATRWRAWRGASFEESTYDWLILWHPGSVQDVKVVSQEKSTTDSSNANRPVDFWLNFCRWGLTDFRGEKKYYFLQLHSIHMRNFSNMVWIFPLKYHVNPNRIRMRCG